MPPRRPASRSRSRSRWATRPSPRCSWSAWTSPNGSSTQQFEILRRERVDGLWDEAATGLACIAAHAGEAERAATFLGFGEAMPTVPAADRDAAMRDRLVARFIAPARAALGDRAWKRATAAGAA